MVRGRWTPPTARRAATSEGLVPNPRSSPRDIRIFLQEEPYPERRVADAIPWISHPCNGYTAQCSSRHEVQDSRDARYPYAPLCEFFIRSGISTTGYTHKLKLCERLAIQVSHTALYLRAALFFCAPVQCCAVCPPPPPRRCDTQGTARNQIPQLWHCGRWPRSPHSLPSIPFGQAVAN